uniref:Uncharacterized protein n=1 Tax=Gallid alphaherpesvirus 2 TaxID=10390 RepID=D2Y5U8_9ALPH|nr:hypothetical protein [Gallid alphaherpesvirus 2]
MVFKYLFTGHGHLKLCNRSAGHNLTRWAGLVCVLEMQCWHLNYLKYTGAGTNLIPHFAIGGGGGGIENISRDIHLGQQSDTYNNAVERAWYWSMA